MLHKRLRDRNCTMMFGSEVKAIGDDSMEINVAGEKTTLSDLDQVIVAAGMKPANQLKGVLENLKIPFTVVGDALAVRRIIEATEEGARAVWDLK
jgi:NADH dehydrogenase FAD-containing subunit